MISIFSTKKISNSQYLLVKSYTRKTVVVFILCLASFLLSSCIPVKGFVFPKSDRVLPFGESVEWNMYSLEDDGSFKPHIPKGENKQAKISATKNGTCYLGINQKGLKKNWTLAPIEKDVFVVVESIEDCSTSELLEGDLFYLFVKTFNNSPTHRYVVGTLADGDFQYWAQKQSHVKQKELKLTKVTNKDGKKSWRVHNLAGAKAIYKDNFDKLKAKTLAYGTDADRMNSKPGAGAEVMLMTPGINGESRSLIQQLANGGTVKINKATIPLLFGITQAITERCSGVIAASDRATLARLSVSGISNLIVGSDYSNPDMRKSWQSQADNLALTTLGVQAGNRLPCTSSAAGKVASLIARSMKANESSNVFINSCTKSFNKTQCGCIAKIGSGVIPDLHQRYYSRSLIKEIIKRNPLLGIQIGLACGVSNY